MDKLDVDVQINPVSIWYNQNSLKPRTKQLTEKNLTNIDFELIIMYPVYSFGRIHKNAAILTMWEANQLPKPWIKAINQLRLPVFAPSSFAAKVFKDSGVTQPVIEFPLGVDKDFYEHRERAFPKDRPFKFLSIGKFEPRKNGNVLIDCFNRAFPEGDTELYIKTRERFLPSKSAGNSNPRIKFLSKTISEEELRQLYYNCDCFVYPSRGEAFSFPPRNAILTGMPTLVTSWSALAEIPGSIQIKTKGLSSMPKCGFSYGEESKLLMADIDEEDFCSLMKYISTPDFYNAECDVVEDARPWHFSWEDCALRLIKYVEGKCLT